MATPYNKPLPQIDDLNRPFWEAAQTHKLVVQVCKACGDRRFPPSPVCPACLSSDQGWVELSGRGTLESWVDFHRAYWSGFEHELPYRVCLVRLLDGPLFVSNLIGDSSHAKYGAEVRVLFDAVTEDVTLPKFELV